MAQQLSARVSIAVVDASGVLLSFRRLDGASIASVETSAAKARTAALTGGTVLLRNRRSVQGV